MKKQTKKKAAAKKKIVSPLAPIQPVSSDLKSQQIAPPGIIVHDSRGEISLRPFPDDLLEEAEQEPNERDLAEYIEVIVTLREKGLSFRDIAGWLSKRGVEADHNAVYRVYTKLATEDEMRLESELEQEEREQAMRG
jgi:hypothetical protein